MTISKFSNEYGFLSNFYYIQFMHDGHTWTTAEHTYQAAKTNSVEWKIKVMEAKTPVLAKRLGKRMPVREDWERIKLQAMEGILRSKFAPTSGMAESLIATGTQKLVEGNYWHDNFWGVCNCHTRAHCGNGKNNLGKLLMKIRDELKERRVLCPK